MIWIMADRPLTSTEGEDRLRVRAVMIEFAQALKRFGISAPNSLA
ncbi:hypothetical protein ACVWZM_004763 [Bradyrhizobium sp. USDA 4501]